VKKLVSIVFFLMFGGAAQGDNSGILWQFDGTMNFVDAGGTLRVVDNNVSGYLDFCGSEVTSQQMGQLSTTQPLFNSLWTADVVQYFFYDVETGGNQTYVFDVTEYIYFNNSAFRKRCTEITGSGTCIAPSDTIYTQIVSHPVYSFSLNNPNQFAMGFFVDWFWSLDIPMLVVMEVVNNPTADGFVQVETLDSDGDGIPGAQLLSGPFPGQQPAFNGTLQTQDGNRREEAKWFQANRTNNKCP